MIAASLLTLVWIVHLPINLWAQNIRWTHEHTVCSANVQKFEHTKECHEAEYVDYVRSHLLNDQREYYQAVGRAIMDLYKDLEDSKKPMVLSFDTSNSKISIVDSSTLKFPEDYILSSSKDAAVLAASATTAVAGGAASAVRRVLIHPITFCLPEENIVETIPPKIKAFGRVIPGITSTYYHLYNESLYFADMGRSLFTITYKKGGWDCLRHYEILAAGSLPLFMSIKHCPSQTISLHPKKLYQLILKFPNLDIKAVRTGVMTMQFDRLELHNIEQMDKGLYNSMVAAMLHYSRNVFSTRAMASYVIDTMVKYSQGHLQHEKIRSILYLTHQDHDMDKGDYMTDFLLHGLLQLYGSEKVTDFPSRDAIYKTLKEFNETSYLNQRLKLYGSGFSWGLKLNVLDTALYRDHKAIKQRILQHKYDLVILGSGHRDGWASRLHFWDHICRTYHPLEVGWVDGSDKHLPNRLIERYSSCAGHMFSREGYIPV